MKPEFSTYTLPNGIRGIHRQVRSGVVHCGLTIGAGARNEPDNAFGVAHFTEHALFKGTAHRKSFHINNRLERLGGELNAFTTKEDTTIHATTLRRDWAKAVELIADIALHSTFPNPEIAREREVILDEINSYRDNPAEQIFDEFEDLLFAGSPLGHNILGTPSSVKRIDSETIRRFVAQNYTPERMVFSSVGNISVGQVEKTVFRYFSDFSKPAFAPEKQLHTPHSSFNTVRNKRTAQSHCIVGGRAYPLEDERRIALALLVNHLGGPAANSVLNVLLREKRGLTYGVDASYVPYSDTGAACIYFSCEKNHIDECASLVEKTLRQLRETPLSTRQLNVAKRQWMGQMTIAMEANEAYMLGAGKALLYGQVETLGDIHHKINALTVNDLRDVANEIFTEPSTLIYK